MRSSGRERARAAQVVAFDAEDRQGQVIVDLVLAADHAVAEAVRRDGVLDRHHGPRLIHRPVERAGEAVPAGDADSAAPMPSDDSPEAGALDGLVNRARGSRAARQDPGTGVAAL